MLTRALVKHIDIKTTDSKYQQLCYVVGCNLSIENENIYCQVYSQNVLKHVLNWGKHLFSALRYHMVEREIPKHLVSMSIAHIEGATTSIKSEQKIIERPHL